MKLDINFYKNDSITVAKKLLGKHIIHNLDGKKIESRIVETEAYMGEIDKASHAYNRRRTNRTEIIFGDAGVSYVYLIYGMYCCFNIVVNEVEVPEAVLIRGVEPIVGLDEMAQNRFKLNYGELNKRQKLSLTNGPGKLCDAMGIDMGCNKLSLLEDKLYLIDTGYNDFEMVETTRINIDYAEEAIHFPWRYYIKGNPYVSKK